MDLTKYDINSCVLIILVILQQMTKCYGHSSNIHQQGSTNTGIKSAAHHQHSSHGDGKVDIDPEHIKEHLDGMADMPENISQEELEFHYFKLHDIDNNTKLDGLEIYKALTHFMPYEEVEENEQIQVDTAGKTPAQIYQARQQASENYYTEIVDNVLAEDDIDKDGYITYLEFVLAKRREEMKEQRTRQHQPNREHL